MEDRKIDTKMTILETEKAIKQVKDLFEVELATELHLIRVSAPMFVQPESGLNDNLNGFERPVSFDVPSLSTSVEVVHSLAKWKRYAIKKYGISTGFGLYTDMNAIRRDEKLDELHSIYVDQWDWEKAIDHSQRTFVTLKETVLAIVRAIKRTEETLKRLYPSLFSVVSNDVYFISSQELEDLYPTLTPKQRENKICEKYGTVFLSQIGCSLKSGKPHDSRSPDYDDWELNGDLLIWYPPLEAAVELTSMGIRVDTESLEKQLKISGCEDRKKREYHRLLLEGQLPSTIGGGIGQSRLCMVLLNKRHVGEVQASVWPKAMIIECEEKGIQLL
ncbi:Asparagine synthase [Monocercomonoides exilis]|uniref:Asparagine synthase n=1 Tax=Monocercomonoides exilis TaxID=2049356 RepID=UPI00355957EB|nr:Asparagine synthase [Monocercomonoides exilis]|eukprot:MONOS_2741.1-p1 / transcript=MONOS_2741.1 / gene=MONOS_2741 / organism=Monocercomonoides_exilis_PA203 / gene_product=Asparagine synthase / transcript_product=Asparagine synthase / location=Mono_scaffold00058:67335-68330(+) / protein_length=332 / sequence_SO=supercontig / SO=protein_coding / is_pseudo=false